MPNVGEDTSGTMLVCCSHIDMTVTGMMESAWPGIYYYLQLEGSRHPPHISSSAFSLAPDNTTYVRTEGGGNCKIIIV